jgi:virulence factor Mce-like protein
MRRRTVAANLMASPTLIGALTVMIVIVAVFLAYNANTGLPFVPTYRVSVQVPDASTLVPGNDVRIGGVRVGLVETIEPQQAEDGSLSAKLDLKLEESVDPLPVDSTVTVRSRSALGLKYLEITEGDSSEGYRQGAVLPLAAARPQPVELDEVLSTFDEPTRVAVQQNLVEFGNALAGRGPQLNAALGRLPGVLEVLQPVMRNLGSPSTGVRRFIGAAGATAAQVAPVAETQAAMFAHLDTTFTALAEVARPYIQESISESPPTELTALDTLPRVRPFLANTAGLFEDLQPAATALDEGAPEIASALDAGVPVLEDAPELNEELAPTLEALEAFGDDEAVTAGLTATKRATDQLGPALRFITPAETVCGYASILASNLYGVVSDGNDLGAWQRFIVFDVPKGPNSEGGPSSAPANGGGPDDKDFLHSNPYPNTAAPGQPRECEPANEPYRAGRQVIGTVPGNQGTDTKELP